MSVTEFKNSKFVLRTTKVKRNSGVLIDRYILCMKVVTFDSLKDLIFESDYYIKEGFIFEWVGLSFKI